MRLSRITGTVWSTRLDEHLRGRRMLVCQPVGTDGSTPDGRSFLALDAGVDAGSGDLVLVNSEGGGARIVFGDPALPLKHVVVAVVDEIDLAP